MKIAVSENLPFVWQEHLPSWEALPSMAMFRAEEKPEEAERLWNVLWLWYEKHVRLFFLFSGRNEYNRAATFHQSDLVAAELRDGSGQEGVWKVWRDLEFALQRKGFFCAFPGEVKGCSLVFASVRDSDRFWAGLSLLGWAQKPSGCAADVAARENQILFFWEPVRVI